VVHGLDVAHAYLRALINLHVGTCPLLVFWPQAIVQSLGVCIMLVCIHACVKLLLMGTCVIASMRTLWPHTTAERMHGTGAVTSWCTGMCFVRERERERERARARARVCVCTYTHDHLCVCLCVCRCIPIVHVCGSDHVNVHVRVGIAVVASAWKIGASTPTSAWACPQTCTAWKCRTGRSARASTPMHVVSTSRQKPFRTGSLLPVKTPGTPPGGGRVLRKSLGESLGETFVSGKTLVMGSQLPCLFGSSAKQRESSAKAARKQRESSAKAVLSAGMLCRAFKPLWGARDREAETAGGGGM
jgi:hypothetical protein